MTSNSPLASGSSLSSGISGPPPRLRARCQKPQPLPLCEHPRRRHLLARLRLRPRALNQRRISKEHSVRIAGELHRRLRCHHGRTQIGQHHHAIAAGIHQGLFDGGKHLLKAGSDALVVGSPPAATSSTSGAICAASSTAPSAILLLCDTTTIPTVIRRRFPCHRWSLQLQLRPREGAGRLKRRRGGRDALRCAPQIAGPAFACHQRIRGHGPCFGSFRGRFQHANGGVRAARCGHLGRFNGRRPSVDHRLIPELGFTSGHHPHPGRLRGRSQRLCINIDDVPQRGSGPQIRCAVERSRSPHPPWT